MVVRGHAGHRALDDSALLDPAIAALRRQVSMVEDPAMTAAAPRLRQARVTVRLMDGRSATHAVDTHRGDFQRPFTEAELRDKFRELAGAALTAEGVALVEQAVNRCEQWDSVDTLTSICRAYGRR
jgi:2-methylcitrate dehydratase PrpD